RVPRVARVHDLARREAATRWRRHCARATRRVVSRRRADEPAQPEGRAVPARAVPAVRRSVARQRARAIARPRRDADRHRRRIRHALRARRRDAQAAARERRAVRGLVEAPARGRVRRARRAARPRSAEVSAGAPASVYAKLVAVAAIWGGTFIAARVVAPLMSAPAAALWRYLVATAALVAFTFAYERGL